MHRILHAMKMAAEKHARQRRKNSDATPYINHPIEVAEHLATVGEISDEDVLIAALLHDTIEDTETTFDEIEAAFGARVANIVLECTDDKSLEKAERKQLQIVNAPQKSPEAKCVKVADKTCNLRSLLTDPPPNLSREAATALLPQFLGLQESPDIRLPSFACHHSLAIIRQPIPLSPIPLSPLERLTSEIQTNRFTTGSGG